MIAPDDWLEICKEELERGSLVSYPRKFDFARKRGMKDLDEVHAWMKQTRSNFQNMVSAAVKMADGMDQIAESQDGEGAPKSVLGQAHEPSSQATPKTKTPDVETLIAASLQHGQDSEPDHEAGDLQEYLRCGWGLLTSRQRKDLLCRPRLKSAIETASGKELRATEKLLQSEGIEKILDIFKEHGNDEGSEAEISDLQDALRSCWDMLTPEQRTELLELDTVQETYENATLEALFPLVEAEETPQRYDSPSP